MAVIKRLCTRLQTPILARWRLIKMAFWFVLLLVFFAAMGRAQFTGYTLPQTTTQAAFTNAACAVTSFQVNNIGQTVHYFLYQNTGTITNFSAEIQGSGDGVTFFRVSETANTTTNGGIYANIYLPVIRVAITACTGSGTISGIYVGTAVANPNALGIFATNSAWNKDVGQDRAANANATFTIPLPNGGTGGAIFFTFSDATCAASTLSVTAGPDSTHQVTIFPATTLTATANTQAYSVPAIPANIAVITYTTGCGASAATYDLSFSIGERIVTSDIDINLQGPGSSPIPTAMSGFACDQFSALSFSAAGPTTFITNTDATKRIYICDFSLSLQVAQSVLIHQGTGANCAVPTGNIYGPAPNVATIALDWGWWGARRAALGSNVCVTFGATPTTAGGGVSFGVF